MPICYAKLRDLVCCIAIYDYQNGWAAGSTTFEGCSSVLDGGAIYAITDITFQSNGPGAVSKFHSNKAGRSGGAIFAWQALKVRFGHQVLVYNNSAGLDGGGFNLESGITLDVQDEGCPSAVCDAQSRSNGKCDLACMTRGCNWCQCLRLLPVAKACISVTCCLLAGITVIVRIVL